MFVGDATSPALGHWEKPTCSVTGLDGAGRGTLLARGGVNYAGSSLLAVLGFVGRYVEARRRHLPLLSWGYTGQWLVRSDGVEMSSLLGG